MIQMPASSYPHYPVNAAGVSTSSKPSSGTLLAAHDAWEHKVRRTKAAARAAAQAMSEDFEIPEIYSAHVFCEGCIKAWVNRKNGRACPVCRPYNLSGDTELTDTSARRFVTMMQVFEYYISHHILANPDIMERYSENVVDTLHKKNLLLLGEDRYLTTLLLKRSALPTSSFVAGMELMGTLVLPAAISFTLYLIIISIIPGGANTTIPLVLLAIVLGLPGLLIVVKSRKVA
ncbi:chitin synthase-domain-containing protein [Suillus tomentosus]|nr:chitin synthase-domain-containing protein [Suillus tomentosus]